MQKTRVVDLTEEVALTAADLSLVHGFAMAHSMMLAAARVHKAELVTTEAGFDGVPGVTILPRRRPMS